MSEKFVKFFITSFFVLIPIFSFGALDEGNLTGLFEVIYNWLYIFFGILMGVATMVFFYGIVRFIISAGDEKKRSEMKRVIVYGVIGLFAMTTVFGFVFLLGNILGIEPGGRVEFPDAGYVISGEDGGLEGVDSPATFLDECDINEPLGSFKNLSCFIVNLLAFLPPILILLALVYFVWGIVRFIYAGNSDEKNSARTAIIYGILALFVMTTIWGLVFFLKSGIGL